MINLFGNLRLKQKLAILGFSSVLAASLLLFLLTLWQVHQYGSLAQKEVDKILDENLTHITYGVYNLVKAQNEAVQARVNWNMNVARQTLEKEGGMSFSQEFEEWNCINQFTGEVQKLRLPQVLIGGVPVRYNPAPDKESPVVDDVTRLTGESCTIFQRMNEKGDMLRIVTTVKTKDEQRAVGTYIPAIEPSGIPNPVIMSIMNGKSYHGMAYVVNQWCLTAYEPIKNPGGGTKGMLYVGTRQSNVVAGLREGIIQTRILKSGYVFVLGGKMEPQRGRYIISDKGERDGEYVWDTKDSDGIYTVREIIAKSTVLKTGEFATLNYRWKNPGEPAPRKKIARLFYYEPWDWVIGTSIYEDELQPYLAVFEEGMIRMSWTLAVTGLIIALLVGLACIRIAYSTLRPVQEMTKAVEAIMKGDLSQKVEIDARDEIGELASAFNIMTARQADTLGKLSESEKNFRAIFDYAVEGIFRTSLDGKILDVNPAFAQILGYASPAELLREVSNIGTQVYARPGARTSLLESIRNADGGAVGLEVELIRKDKSLIWVAINAKFVQDQEGNILFIEGFMIDISAQKNAAAEREKLEDQLRQAQKMESIGRLAGGVAHDFNNLLMPIIGYSDLLMSTVPLSKHREALSKIKQAALIAKDLTNQLLAFGRKQVLELKPTDLCAIVRGFEKLLRRTIHEDIEILLSIPQTLQMVNADQRQMEQILLNLAVNAQDAMTEKGTLSIALKDVRPTESPWHLEIPSGSYVCLSVSDSGCGMNSEVRAKIFEPFFTTKELGHGTGLGLSTVYGIIKQHGGYINVYSEPGKGSVFNIYLPALEFQPNQEKASVEQEQKIIEGRNESILVMEDNESVRALVCQMLEELKYQFIAPEQVEDCKMYIRERQVDLLLTDVLMPGMNGKELAAALKEIKPELKVVFMSGYPSGVIIQRGVLDKGMDFIHKPFTLTELSKILSRAFGH